MSLKDEIENLISLARKQIREGEAREEEYRNRRIQRFVPFRAVLNELAIAIDPAHIKALVYDDCATIRIGQSGPDFTADIEWEIAPEDGIDFEADDSRGTVRKDKGFLVKETLYFRAINESSYSERSFTAVDAAAEYIVRQTAEKIAYYRELGEEWPTDTDESEQ